MTNTTVRGAVQLKRGEDPGALHARWPASTGLPGASLTGSVPGAR